MPRRISDYPDAFAGWNLISSYGSIISVVATWLFLHILYVQLVEGKATLRYPWSTSEFSSDTLQILLSRAFPSLEWGLSSPPKPHAFASLPVQSGFLFILHSIMDLYSYIVDLIEVINIPRSQDDTSNNISDIYAKAPPTNTTPDTTDIDEYLRARAEFEQMGDGSDDDDNDRDHTYDNEPVFGLEGQLYCEIDEVTALKDTLSNALEVMNNVGDNAPDKASLDVLNDPKVKEAVDSQLESMGYPSHENVKSYDHNQVKDALATEVDRCTMDLHNLEVLVAIETTPDD